MLKIKLKPNGKIHQRSFRIVVSPDRSKSNGKFVDDIGFYTPQTKTLQIDKDKMAKWIKNGAQLTEGVDKLLNPAKYPRPIKVKKEKEIKVETKVETEKVEVAAPVDSPTSTVSDEQNNVDTEKEVTVTEENK
ncbi:MAG: 30S ribosomal protein S16 [Candidatus Shapirobacteria bacterium]